MRAPGIRTGEPGGTAGGRGSALRLALAAAIAVVIPLVISLLVVHDQRDNGASGSAPPVEQASNTHLLLAVCAIVGAALVGGRIATALRQPAVVGEILAGVALGPTLLGRFAPEAKDWLFPASVLPMLHGLAVVGLVLFMFGVGRELADLRLRDAGSGPRAVLVTSASVLFPFAVGAVLAATVAAAHTGALGNSVALVLFLGCALSVTAMPVLARILEDLDLTDTRVGRLSLFAAAAGDAVAWLLLAVALATAQGAAGGSPLGLLLAAAAVVALLLGPVRWALRFVVARLEAGPHPDGFRAAAPIVIAVAACAALTAAAGIHEIIGALLAGVICPRGNAAVDAAATRLAGVMRVVLLPVFFTGFGLSIDLAAPEWNLTTLGVGAALLAGAVVTKVVGAGLCARLTGMTWQEAGGLGALLNARGLTELVVLQIGWEAGIIDAALLAVMVVVTLVTTTMAAPLLALTRYPRVVAESRESLPRELAQL
jgi:Kef-type K+ transport system membrane component KefB